MSYYMYMIYAVFIVVTMSSVVRLCFQGEGDSKIIAPAVIYKVFQEKSLQFDVIITLLTKDIVSELEKEVTFQVF